MMHKKVPDLDLLTVESDSDILTKRTALFDVLSHFNYLIYRRDKAVMFPRRLYLLNSS